MQTLDFLEKPARSLSLFRGVSDEEKRFITLTRGHPNEAEDRDSSHSG